MAPSHYMNQCGLITNEILWHSPEGIFTGYLQNIYLWYEFKKFEFKITAASTKGHWVNSLAPGKFEWNLSYVIFKQILVIDGWGICGEIDRIWMSLDFTDDQLTLVQVMAWCRQATSHYLSQCWPRSLSPSGVTRPQWVNGIVSMMRGSIRN